MSNSNPYSGKIAVVTGASRGIGAAAAISLAKAGVSRLILHYNSYPEGVETVVKAIREAGAEGGRRLHQQGRVKGTGAEGHSRECGESGHGGQSLPRSLLQSGDPR